MEWPSLNIFNGSIIKIHWSWSPTKLRKDSQQKSMILSRDLKHKIWYMDQSKKEKEKVVNFHFNHYQDFNWAICKISSASIILCLKTTYFLCFQICHTITNHTTYQYWFLFLLNKDNELFITWIFLYQWRSHLLSTNKFITKSDYLGYSNFL